jgi:hypothetical protein
MALFVSGEHRVVNMLSCPDHGEYSAFGPYQHCPNCATEALAKYEYAPPDYEDSVENYIAFLRQHNVYGA